MKTLVIVDVQRDFYSPAGRLYVAGSEVLPAQIASIIPSYDSVVFTLDWHPADHCSFKEQGGLWPAHCVQFTEGAGLAAEFTPVLHRPGMHFFLKGKDSGKEQYGAFEDMSADDPILDVFRSSDEIHVCGIAGDYCVKSTIANLISLGFKDKVVSLVDVTAYFDGGVTFGKFLEETSLRTAKAL